MTDRPDRLGKIVRFRMEMLIWSNYDDFPHRRQGDFVLLGAQARARVDIAGRSFRRSTCESSFSKGIEILVIMTFIPRDDPSLHDGPTGSAVDFKPRPSLLSFGPTHRRAIRKAGNTDCNIGESRAGSS